MKKLMWIGMLVLGLLTWIALVPLQREAISPEPTNRREVTADQTGNQEAWRRYANTREKVASMRTEAPGLPRQSPLRVADPFTEWRDLTISGDRVKKLIELVGKEHWPPILPPVDGHAFTVEDVLRNYSFLRGPDGGYDAEFVAEVQSVLQRIHDADSMANGGFTSSQSLELRNELRMLLGPVVGWTPERRGIPVVTAEFVALVPEMREAAPFQIRNFMSALALLQTSAERRPKPDRYKYPQDLARVVGGSCRIQIGLEQAEALLATPLERLVTSRNLPD